MRQTSRQSSLPTADARHDPSEREDGPALIAVPGGQRGFELGTREIDWHAHRRGQVFCVESGCVHVRTPHGSWLLPPNRAGWIPPGVPHRIGISGVLSGWSVVVSPRASRALPALPCVIALTELMGALVRRAVTWHARDVLSPEEVRIGRVLLDEIRRAPHEPLHLPMPADRRLVRIASRILAQPHEGRTLEEWASWAGLSASTLSRLFLAETGTRFAQWRQQARLTLALERLAAGDAVAEVADALGYATPSNFIAMFRRAFGESPARYFAQRGGR